MRKLRTELAMMHEREIAGSLAFDELLKEHRGRPAADVAKGRRALGRVPSIAGAGLRFANYRRARVAPKQVVSRRLEIACTAPLRGLVPGL